MGVKDLFIQTKLQLGHMLDKNKNKNHCERTAMNHGVVSTAFHAYLRYNIYSFISYANFILNKSSDH